jgi:hypothetical protein
MATLEQAAKAEQASRARLDALKAKLDEKVDAVNAAAADYNATAIALADNPAKENKTAALKASDALRVAEMARGPVETDVAQAEADHTRCVADLDAAKIEQAQAEADAAHATAVKAASVQTFNARVAPIVARVLRDREELIVQLAAELAAEMERSDAAAAVAGVPRLERWRLAGAFIAAAADAAPQNTLALLSHLSGFGNQFAPTPGRTLADALREALDPPLLAHIFNTRNGITAPEDVTRARADLQAALTFEGRLSDWQEVQAAAERERAQAVTVASCATFHAGQQARAAARKDSGLGRGR